jgi:hypothetical protein
MGHTFSRPIEHNCVQILYGVDKGDLSPPYPAHYNESDEEKTMITWTKRLLLTASFLALITTNIHTLTSTAFNAAVSGLMGTALGIRTVSSMMQTKLTSQDKAIKKHKATTLKRKAATRKFGTRLATRTKRVAVKSIAAILAESIPFIGVAVLIADTGYELYAACETVRDLDQLYADLGMVGEVRDDVMCSVCDTAYSE